MKVFEAIVDGLVAEGVTDVFGLMGDGNMLVMAAAAARPELRLTHSRHEGAALTTAVGYAAATGGVGVCTVTCGPGLTQLGTALVDAVRRRAPTVVLAGDLASSDTHINQYFVQRPFVEATGAQYLALTAPGDVADVIATAFFRARASGTTVVVGLPMHLQDTEYPWDWSYRPSGDAIPRLAPLLHPRAEETAALAALLADAEHPVIVAGAGAIGLAAEIKRLADLSGALLATTLRAKGLFAGHPYDAGIAGAFSTGTARALFAEADVVVGLGASLNYFTTEGGYLFPAARMASVDTGEPRLRMELSLDLLVRADAGVVVEDVTARLSGGGPRRAGFRTAEVASRLADDQPVELRQPAQGLHPVGVVRELDEAFVDDTVFVIGVGHFWSFPIMYLGGRGPSSYHVTYDFGAIGQGLPTAMGFATARGDRPTVLIEGDGSLLMHIQEFETLRRSPTRLLIVVMNDGNYGAEVHKLAAKGLPVATASFGAPDFAAIATAFGLRGRTAVLPGQLAEAVKEFLHDPQPTVVDVRIDGSVVSAPYLRSVFGRDE
jgi:acetolactate synthase-1/2/3 large subunit